MRSMKNFIAVALLLLAAPLFGQQAPTTVAPLTKTGVATGCTTVATCTFVDTAVPPGQHFYFIVAVNTTSDALYSKPSNRVDVTVPSGTHSVTLNWNPGPTTVTYYVYRGAPATGLGAAVK